MTITSELRKNSSGMVRFRLYDRVMAAQVTDATVTVTVKRSNTMIMSESTMTYDGSAKLDEDDPLLGVYLKALTAAQVSSTGYYEITVTAVKGSSQLKSVKVVPCRVDTGS